ncbi:MAG: MFS transporter [Enhydrobacter sp.]|nr:MFS transporter [Enhydrobacter sp.]
MSRMFYGWRIVAVCLVASVFANALGLFGAGVYLHALVEQKGWPTGLVSGAITLFYVVSALLLIPVGGILGRFGPQPIFALGITALAAGVAAIGHLSVPWQTYAAFLVMGIGWACLSMTAVATTLAPWFERHQGRAVSIASLGASVGGLAGVPVLLFGIDRLGLSATTTVGAVIALAVMLPPAVFVLKRRPQDIGLLPDGAVVASSAAAPRGPAWTRRDALRTAALRSVMAGFGIGMMVQVGFVTHQVTLLSPVLGTAGTSVAVSLTAIAALLSRLLLARFADQISARTTAAAMMIVAAGALSAMAIWSVPAMLIAGSALMGMTIGNVTTLAPIIVRREFGAAAFGGVYGIASCVIQLAIALGPSFYGLLHDASGNYRLPLLLAAAIDVGAALVVLAGSAKAVRP